MGVWIETKLSTALGPVAVSLLMWECGLEPVRVKANPNTHLVTPYVGVWIETRIPWYLHTGGRRSLLMWECGLKPNNIRA